MLIQAMGVGCGLSTMADTTEGKEISTMKIHHASLFAPHGAGNTEPGLPDSEPAGERGKVSASPLGGREESLYCLSVIGQIEGHYVLPEEQKATKYEQLIPLLVSVEENKDYHGLLIILNTMGGDVEAGLALAELIASMKKPTVTLVLGGSHSIGVPLAVAGKRSFIVPSATMTLHPVRISGTVIGAPQTYRYFHDMQDRILTFVASHSHASKETVRQLMMKPDEIANDIGSILDGEEAVRAGLIDEIGGLDAALSALKAMIQKGWQSGANTEK